ncbi:uncharacterized protein V6R79_013218 [Siganus canaliculatus]
MEASALPRRSEGRDVPAAGGKAPPTTLCIRQDERRRRRGSRRVIRIFSATSGLAGVLEKSQSTFPNP